MAATQRTPPSGGHRPRGRKAGLDLARIVQAARSLDVDALTMQAVADILGVDRKAINHHVSDRETLLRLVAQDTFSENSSAVDIPANAPWQEACRIYAMAFTGNMITLDVLAEHLGLGSALFTRFVAPSEALLTKLIEAGFDDEAAVRSIALLTNICVAYARDIVSLSHSGERPRPLITREVLNEQGYQNFENLTRILSSPVDTYDRKQLELSIEVFLSGTEAVVLNQHEAVRSTENQ